MHLFIMTNTISSNINSLNTNINNHKIKFITSLIDLYNKSGDIDNAFNIFNNISKNTKDFISIGSMMN